MTYTALLRFSPEVALALDRDHNSAPDPVHANAFDASLSVEAATIFEAAAAALDAASALALGRPARDSHPPVVSSTAFPVLAHGIGVQVLHARDGWVALAAPDRATWLTLSMTFLRRRLYHRYDELSAWRSAEVNELATLVLATHHAEDVVGTCDTYGIPAFLVPGWQGAQSAALAEAVHYGALVRI